MNWMEIKKVESRLERRIHDLLFLGNRFVIENTSFFISASRFSLNIASAYPTATGGSYLFMSELFNG